MMILCGADTNSKVFQMLTIIDECIHGCLGVKMELKLSLTDVLNYLNKLLIEPGKTCY